MGQSWIWHTETSQTTYFPHIEACVKKKLSHSSSLYLPSLKLIKIFQFTSLSYVLCNAVLSPTVYCKPSHISPAFLSRFLRSMFSITFWFANRNIKSFDETIYSNLFFALRVLPQKMPNCNWQRYEFESRVRLAHIYSIFQTFLCLNYFRCINLIRWSNVHIAKRIITFWDVRIHGKYIYIYIC